MNGDFAWTEPRVETLKRGWADGLSASEIARELLGNQSMLPLAEREHLTRSAVCGKLQRQYNGPSEYELTSSCPV